MDHLHEHSMTAHPHAVSTSDRILQNVSRAVDCGRPVAGMPGRIGSTAMGEFLKNSSWKPLRVSRDPVTGCS